MHKLSKCSLRAIHTSLCKTLQNTKSNKFYKFCPKNLPRQSNQSCLNIQSCYSKHVYLYGYCSFAFYFYYFFLSPQIRSLSHSLSHVTFPSLSSSHSLLYLPHQICCLLNTKSLLIPIIKYFNYRNLSLQTQYSHTISTSNTSPTQTHNLDPHKLGFFFYLASSLVDFYGFTRVDVQAWKILWVCRN